MVHISDVRKVSFIARPHKSGIFLISIILNIDNLELICFFMTGIYSNESFSKK